MISDLPCQGVTDSRLLDGRGILDLADKRGVPRRQGCGLIDLRSRLRSGEKTWQRDALGHALCNPEREPFADMAAHLLHEFRRARDPEEPGESVEDALPDAHDRIDRLLPDIEDTPDEAKQDIPAGLDQIDTLEIAGDLVPLPDDDAERVVLPEQVDDAGEPGADRLPEPGCTILCGADKPVPSGADRTDDGVPVVPEQVHPGNRGRDREEESEELELVPEPLSAGDDRADRAIPGVPDPVDRPGDHTADLLPPVHEPAGDVIPIRCQEVERRPQTDDPDNDPRKRVCQESRGERPR